MFSSTTKRLLCLAIVAIVFVSCDNADPFSRSKTAIFSEIRMSIRYKVIIGQPLTEKELARIQRVINGVFEEVDAIYNEWNPNSEVAVFNKMPAGENIPLSPQLERFLNQIAGVVTLTEGRFDPTVEPLVQLWRQELSNGRAPTDDEIASVGAFVGWDKIQYGDGYITKSHDQTSLNVGGIAKGLCVDLLVERFNAEGYKNVYVEWGGEVRTSGHHPDDRPWMVSITDPGNLTPQDAIATVALHGNAIASSGDYFQQWTDQTTNTTYTHIIDPRTRYPLTVTDDRITATTVVAPSCALADALATTAMMFSNAQEARAWAEEIQKHEPETAFWLMTKQGDSHPVDGEESVR